MNVGLIHDIDLDGTGASIFIKNAVALDTSERTRYTKIEEAIYNMARNCDHLIVADLALEPNQLKDALKMFKHVTIFDHHERSLPYAKFPQNSHFSHNISIDSCSAKLAYDYYKDDTGSNAHELLARLINVYDLWQTTNKLFWSAYDLNALYWEYGYQKFYEEFNGGMRAFKPVEKEWLEEMHRKKKEIIENSPSIELPSGSVIFLTEDKTVINDYTLHYDKYRVYYMVRYDGTKKNYAASIRLRRYNEFQGKINLDKACTDAWQSGFISPDTVTSTGGHREATGVDFSSKATIDDVLLFIDAVERQVDEQLGITA